MTLAQDGHRFCRDCDQDLPLTEFYVQGRDARGTPNGWNTICKRCEPARARRRRQLLLQGRLRQQHPAASTYCRALADLDTQACEHPPGAPAYIPGQEPIPFYPYARPYREPLSEAEHVDPEPLCEWIVSTYPSCTLAELGRLFGVDDRVVEQIIKLHTSRLTLRIVDRILTSVGRPDLLEALYPLQAA